MVYEESAEKLRKPVDFRVGTVPYECLVITILSLLILTIAEQSNLFPFGTTPYIKIYCSSI